MKCSMLYIFRALFQAFVASLLNVDFTIFQSKDDSSDGSAIDRDRKVSGSNLAGSNEIAL